MFQQSNTREGTEREAREGGIERERPRTERERERRHNGRKKKETERRRRIHTESQKEEQYTQEKKWKEARSVCRRGVFSSCIMHHDRIWGIKAFLTKSWRLKKRMTSLAFWLVLSHLLFHSFFSFHSWAVGGRQMQRGLMHPETTFVWWEKRRYRKERAKNLIYAKATDDAFLLLSVWKFC